MAILFLDSSAVAKRYVTETGSQWVRAVLDPAAANEIHVSVMTGAEVVAAITRRRRVGSLDAAACSAAIGEFLDDWEHLYNHVAVDENVIARAMQVAERHELRGYDSVQLATAVTLHGRYRGVGLGIVLVSADEELNTAALAEGLTVENPNLLP